MFTESTQMYFSVIVQMSIGNERKKNSQNKPSRSSRQEMGAGGGSLYESAMCCVLFKIFLLSDPCTATLFSNL